ncbi:MAG: hypothetical protein AB7Q37_09065 [Pyrinomonadaceae bacterium]
MTPTQYRDQVAKLARTDPRKGNEIGKKIDDPWFQAQAWSHLARWADRPLPFARKAAKAAAETKDDYQRSAVRAWEIAALAERQLSVQARRSLREAVDVAVSVTPIGSRAESLFLLFQAAFKISAEAAATVSEAFDTSCNATHWRVVRARKEMVRMLNGEMPPREFFW